MSISHPIPAATLVLFRERGDGPPELLMVERAKAMAFAGGAMVFPGGRIDPGDEALAELHPDLPDAAARIAAIRETVEEAGIAVGIAPPPPPSPDQLAALRAKLHAGEAFGRALEEAGLALDLTALTPFARWLPAHQHPRIFDTLFFLARAPEGAEATVDRTENVRLVWTSARAMLDEVDAGRAAAIFPTRRNLERLALFASFDDAVVDARAHPIRAVTPWVEEREGAEHLCIPDDLGYPITSEPLTAAVRG
ncbi:NUDIX hydrolase [Sphingomonas lenta]|uniref:NUDIX hydrolase n=1 Tax=Sphingomonas lenta TaxID=1141887 RepID=A0A2A2SID6_9SPHN|nr:NUDIX domain-containing protein [Sphingomonas lenta]PAX08781.1 NUDIX hydrolase [Sphingomonas lenta]